MSTGTALSGYRLKATPNRGLHPLGLSGTFLPSTDVVMINILILHVFLATGVSESWNVHFNLIASAGRPFTDFASAWNQPTDVPFWPAEEKKDARNWPFLTKADWSNQVRLLFYIIIAPDSIWGYFCYVRLMQADGFTVVISINLPERGNWTNCF